MHILWTESVHILKILDDIGIIQNALYMSTLGFKIQNVYSTSNNKKKNDKIIQQYNTVRYIQFTKSENIHLDSNINSTFRLFLL